VSQLSNPVSVHGLTGEDFMDMGGGI